MLDTPGFCENCGTALSSGALSCPACNQLVFASRLQFLAIQANQAEGTGHTERLRETWQEMVSLLPPDSIQAQTLRIRLEALPPPISPLQDPGTPHRWNWRKLVGQFGIAGALLWKFKAFLLVLLTKGKFLILGLTKLSTLTSMLAFLGVYWALYGWMFALGIVIAIYIHEMGHVSVLRGYGIPASAPMFIPGLGAFVLVKDQIKSVAQDARVGLAGPIWGTGAAALSFLLGLTSGLPIFYAICHVTAVMNLFNLIPIGWLDGGRGFVGLTRKERGMVAAGTAVMWALTHEAMFFLVLLGAGYRLFTKDYAPAPDRPVLSRFLFLLGALGLLALTRTGFPRE